uniref:AP-3 complex subunit beta n=1 Tax=Panagrolaimus sp. PS1159 TaxID=55785 RepID=A0AC35FXM3_9BILA
MSLFQGGTIMRGMAYAEGLTSPEIEIAEGAMLDNKSKFSDLKAALDSNKENLKMDAMKRIISMVAKGKDVSELFPAVVKNVAVKNLELKKLVYVYLVRYAEEQQDLALLSVSTFQKALQDPNQLIRASALRVLSSIRVPMITTVMLLALKASVRDMSAYVRKVAAHAIPKLYSLNQDLLTDLLECIDYLLGDKRTLVLGSAVYAFEETCPDRLDLLHKHFRSLCRALADVDEWGQIIMVGLLTRYSRTQFISPRDDQEQLDPDHTLLILSARPLLQSRNCSVVMAVAQLLYYIAPPSQLSVVPKALVRLLHHTLLILSARPLLQSRNCAVVMAVAQLLYYIAPSSQLSVVPKALVRLLRGPNEVQYVVLVNIATICATRNNMNLFEPFLKSFFVRSSDSMHVKLLKLQVLTSLVTETNVQLVIRELQAYLQMSDLASAAIEAIGRCALHISGSSDTCLSCLINLISSPKENIVCASVVVLKRLLHADAPIPLLKRVIKLIHSIRAPPARACVIWLISTHIEKVPTLAPDLLRILAKTFCDEADIVKLQILNLAIRLWATDRSKCELLVKYVIQLARYDRSYDIRDRCRFLRNLLLKDDSKFPLKIFMTDKPAPAVHSQYSDRENFQLGTLSHLLNQKCNGYTELPDFPEIAPDPTVRRNAMPLSVDEIGKDALKGQKGQLDKFYSDDEKEEESESEEDESSEEEEEEEVIVPVKPTKKIIPTKKEPTPKPSKTSSTPKSQTQDFLVDLDFSDVSAGIFSNFLRTSSQYVNPKFHSLLPSETPTGLSIEYRFTRAPSLFSNSMLSIEFRVSHKNSGSESSEILLIPDSNGPPNSGALRFAQIKPHEFRQSFAGIDFEDCKCASNWTVEFNKQTYQISIIPNLGELIEGIELSKKQFDEEKKRLSGAHEHSKRFKPTKMPIEAEKIYQLANCKSILCSDLIFAAQTVSKKDILLISLTPKSDEQYELEINCNNVKFGVHFMKELIESLSQ